MAEIAGRVVIEIVGDLSDLDKSLRSADQKAATASKNMVGSFEKIEFAQRKTTTASEKLQQSIEKSMQQSASGSRVTDMIEAGHRRLAAENDNLARAMGGVGRASGLARHELINLGRQVQDVGTMLAMGASPFQIIASQGAQIADVFASTNGTMKGFFAQVAGGFGRFALSGAGLATGGALLGGAAVLSAIRYADAQRDVENALRGVGAASGATVSGINRIAEAEAAAAKVSIASAREIASTFASTGKVDPTQLPGLTSFTKQYSAMRGLGTAEASQELAGAFADPARGAEMLAGKIGGLSDASRRWIADQQAAGNMLGAQRTLLSTFTGQVTGATERTGVFAQAWDKLARSISGVDNALGEFIAGQPTALQKMEDLIKQRDRFAALPTRTQGATAHVAGLDAEIKKLEAVVELDRQREEIDTRIAKAQAAGRAASDITDRLDPYSKSLREITEQVSALEKARALNPRDGQFDAWGKSLTNLKTALETMLPLAGQERLAGDLAVKAIQARTVADRMQLAVDRERLELTRGITDAELARTRALNEQRAVQAQATRDAQDALRVSRDQLALAGKTGIDRFRLEQEQNRRDNLERFGGATTSMLPASTAAASSLDTAFAKSLKQLADAFPGITITSGFRTYEQQAKLYAEKPHLAAPPGRSQHETGLAADLAYKGSGNIPSWLREKAGEYGINFPLANRARNPEPWHAEPIGGRALRAEVRPQANRNGATDEIYNNAFNAREKDMRQSVIGASEEDLKRQTAALDLQRSSMFLSTEESAKASKQLELFNALVRAGGEDLAGKFSPQIEAAAAGYGRLAKATEDFQKMNDAMRTARDIGGEFMSGFARDLKAGKSAAEALENAVSRLSDRLLDMAANSVMDVLFGKSGGGGGGGLIGKLITSGLTASANGNVFGAGGIHAFANGGAFTNTVVSKPTLFPFANGTGLMGEAGPEAIMPLSRGRDGKLGVAAAPMAPANSNASAAKQEARPVMVTVNVPGATGNQEVQRMVAAGVAQGMATVRQQVPEIVMDFQRRAG